jgi:hypothetical protein
VKKLTNNFDSGIFQTKNFPFGGKLVKNPTQKKAKVTKYDICKFAFKHEIKYLDTNHNFENSNLTKLEI